MSKADEIVESVEGAEAEAPATDAQKVEQLESAVPTPKKSRKKLIILGAIAAVVVAVGVGFFVWHNQPSFCATVCHDTMGKYLDTYETSDYLVHEHAEAGLTCLDCHIPTLEEQISEALIQIKGEYRLPLAKLQVEDEFCLRDGCHTTEQLKTVVVIDGKGQKAMPHLMTIDDSAAQMVSPHGAGGESLACSTCHTSHRPSKEINYCYDTCHHPGTFQSCMDCHAKASSAAA